MGIKDLWSLLTPYCERKPLFELSNKVVAIDLSGWVCESLNVVDYFVHPRFYLRNLFFRTCYLLVTGITPVFVLEGAAPPLKYGVILKRNQQQFRGARPRKEADCDKGVDNKKKDDPAKQEQKRNRFNHVLKQCEDLLKSMGLVCVQGPGEAEAFCAYLNQDGMVDGVISQDSDCFAYGAVKVLRNFSASANGGFVDIYDMENIRKTLDLSQEKIVVMGLLSGCDYCPNGVEGAGKESVYKLIKLYPSNNILDKIKSWRSKADRLTDLELKVEDKNVCTNCGHNGRLQSHTRSGCIDCSTQQRCNETAWKEQRLEIRAELEIRRKALLNPNFPVQGIIDEFLVRPCDLPPLDLEWKQPNLIKFIRNLSKLLQWDEIYCFQKFFPLFIRWQVLHLSRNDSNSINVKVNPDFIKKKRAPKGVSSYEIVWKDENNIFGGLIPDEQLKHYLEGIGNTLESLWSTIEPHELVEKAYPDLLETFLDSKKKKNKKVKTPKKKDKENKKAKENRKPKGNLLDKFLTKKDPKLLEDDRSSSLDNLQELMDSIHEIENPTRNPTRKRESKDYEADNDGKYSSLNNLSCLMDSIYEIENSKKGIVEWNKQPKDFKDNLRNVSIDSIDLENIGNDDCASDDLDISGAMNRIYSPNYGKRFKSADDEDNFDQKKCLEAIHSYSFAIADVDVDDDEQIEHRLLLKEDIIASNDHANTSIFNTSVRHKKRQSYFFEPLDGAENEMDMFECSLLIKDQFVVPVTNDLNGTLNQTIVYDIDF